MGRLGESESPRWVIDPQTGCYLHNDCLTCPLPLCIHDEPLKDQLHKALLLRIHDLWRTGDYTAGRLAKMLKVHRSVVARAIIADRNELLPYRIVEKFAVLRSG